MSEATGIATGRLYGGLYGCWQRERCRGASHERDRVLRLPGRNEQTHDLAVDLADVWAEHESRRRDSRQPCRLKSSIQSPASP